MCLHTCAILSAGFLNSSWWNVCETAICYRRWGCYQIQMEKAHFEQYFLKGHLPPWAWLLIMIIIIVGKIMVNTKPSLTQWFHNLVVTLEVAFSRKCTNYMQIKPVQLVRLLCTWYSLGAATQQPCKVSGKTAWKIKLTCPKSSCVSATNSSAVVAMY